MQYGFVVPWADAGEVADLAAVAEEAGWDGCSCGSRCGASTRGSRWALPPCARRSIRLGTMLTPPSRRRPGAGQPGRDRRPAVGGQGDRCRSGSGARQRVRRLRRGDRPPHPRRAGRRVPRRRHRAVGRPAVLLRRQATTRSSRPRSRPSAPPCSSRGCRSGASERSARRSRWQRRCAGTACFRRWSSGRCRSRSTLDRDRRPRRARRPAVRHRHRGRGIAALAGGVGRRRCDVVDRVDVGGHEREPSQCSPPSDRLREGPPR